MDKKVLKKCEPSEKNGEMFREVDNVVAKIHFGLESISYLSPVYNQSQLERSKALETLLLFRFQKPTNLDWVLLMLTRWGIDEHFCLRFCFLRIHSVMLKIGSSRVIKIDEILTTHFYGHFRQFAKKFLRMSHSLKSILLRTGVYSEVHMLWLNKTTAIIAFQSLSRSLQFFPLHHPPERFCFASVSSRNCFADNSI